MRVSPFRRTFLVLLLSFAATHGVYQVGRAFFHPKQGLDLAPPYLAGRMLRDGSTAFFDDASLVALGASFGMHGPEGAGAPVLNFLYPPWVAAFYAPLSFLPWEAARHLWFFLSLLLSGLGLAVAVRAVLPRGAETRSALVAAFAFACFYFPIPYGLMAGQANDLLLFLMAGGLFLLSRERPLAAGLVLAPALFWKPFLLAVVPFLLLRKEWKALAGIAFGGATLFLVSLSAGGTAAWQDWYLQISVHNAAGAVEPRNHGIAGAVLALGLPAGTSAALATSLRALALLATILLVVPRTHAGEPRYVLQFAASLVPALLLTPKAWEHYGVFLLPAFVAAAAIVMREGKPMRAAFVLGASFAVWGLFLQGKEEYHALQEAGLPFLIPVKTAAAFGLLFVAVWLVWKRPLGVSPHASDEVVARPSL